MVTGPTSNGYCKQATDNVLCGACYAVCPRVGNQPAETLGTYLELLRAKSTFDVPRKQSGGAVTVILAHALDAGLIDEVALSQATLLEQLNGFEVEISDGNRSLRTLGATTETLEMSAIEQLLLIVTDPNIVFILLSLGVLAIQVELTHPGTWVPGFIGVTCLALAIYALGVLPVNYFGLELLDGDRTAFPEGMGGIVLGHPPTGGLELRVDQALSRAPLGVTGLGSLHEETPLSLKGKNADPPKRIGALFAQGSFKVIDSPTSGARACLKYVVN